MQIGDVVATYVLNHGDEKSCLRVGRLEKIFDIRGTRMAVIRRHDGSKIVNAFHACYLEKPSTLKMKTLNLDAFM